MRQLFFWHFFELRVMLWLGKKKFSHPLRTTVLTRRAHEHELSAFACRGMSSTRAHHRHHRDEDEAAPPPPPAVVRRFDDLGEAPVLLPGLVADWPAVTLWRRRPRTKKKNENDDDDDDDGKNEDETDDERDDENDDDDGSYYERLRRLAGDVTVEAMASVDDVFTGDMRSYTPLTLTLSELLDHAAAAERRLKKHERLKKNKRRKRPRRHHHEVPPPSPENESNDDNDDDDDDDDAGDESERQWKQEQEQERCRCVYLAQAPLWTATTATAAGAGAGAAAAAATAGGTSSLSSPNHPSPPLAPLMEDVRVPTLLQPLTRGFEELSSPQHHHRRGRRAYVTRSFLRSFVYS